MGEPGRQQDPSMDEILNSIRKIVAEDARQRGKRVDPARPVSTGDRTAVLDLTEVVTADGSIFSIADQQQHARTEPGPERPRLEAAQGGVSPRETAAARAAESWAAVQGAWTRALGLESELKSSQREAGEAAGEGVLERLAREQDGLTRRLALVGAVRDAVLAGARMIGSLGDMVARDVGLPVCDLTALAPGLRSSGDPSEPSLESAQGGWERVLTARSGLLAAEQRLAGAEKAWSTRRNGGNGAASPDPLNLLEAEHEHLLARSAVVAAQREEIVAAHALTLAIQALSERRPPG